MSITPFLYGEYAYLNHNEIHQPQRRHFHNPNFYPPPDNVAGVLTAQEYLALTAVQKLLRSPSQATSMIGVDGFQVCMDVHQFQPDEITVKTVDNNVVVEGKQKERQDEHGFVSQQFTRKFILPKDYEPNEVISTLSTNGVLMIKCPPPKSDKGKEHIVQVQHIDPALSNFKETKCQANGNIK